jgi:hypothetical protein
MYLRQAGLTRNPTFSYLYSVRCQGQDAASEAPLERKYSRYAQAPRTRRILRPQSKIHPASLLIGFAAFQIGSALRGDGDAVDNFFTAPRFTAPEISVVTN